MDDDERSNHEPLFSDCNIYENEWVIDSQRYEFEAEATSVTRLQTY